MPTTRCGVLRNGCYLLLELPVEPLVPPEPTVPLELEPMPVLEDGVEGEVVELELEDGLVVLEDGLLLDPVLEPCVRRQSVFAVPVSVSQLVLELEPDALLGLLVLELGLVVELLEPAVLLGLEVLLLGLLELELWASDTVAKPASAAAMAMPSAFFIMVDSSELEKRMLRPRAASAVPRRDFVV